MKFSQSIGKTPIKTTFQIESIDNDLKNRLWNCIIESYFERLDSSKSSGESQKMAVSKHIWKEFFKERIDEFPTLPLSTRPSVGHFIEYVRNWFFNSEWYEIYDFIELLSRIDSNNNFQLNFAGIINEALEQEVAGYRVIGNSIAQITSDGEIAAIEEAFQNVDKWNSVKTHLAAALDYFSDRKNPDYRNSIKEAVSAVESLCKIITGDDKATLGKALTEIESKHQIHGALKTAFSAIYGYTSDSGGIRHALLETDTVVGSEEAKFMLISCSAFINYVVEKSR